MKFSTTEQEIRKYQRDLQNLYAMGWPKREDYSSPGAYFSARAGRSRAISNRQNWIFNLKKGLSKWGI